MFVLGNNGRRKSICWFSWYIIYWNIIKIFFICPRSILTYSSRNLWHVNWRTNTCSKWVFGFFFISISLFNLIFCFFFKMGWCKSWSENSYYKSDSINWYNPECSITTKWMLWELTISFSLFCLYIFPLQNSV